MRCLNIDWLEVYALEPPEEPRTPDYFRSRGWWVQERAYGTRIYAQMFTLLDQLNEPFIEVRRSPMSRESDGGLLPFNACHIRIVNRYCYHKQIIQLLQQFLSDNNYLMQRISRIDLCLDFERFDSKDEPVKFIRRYMEGKYSKVNQALVHAHGTDVWDGRDWQSLSWGKIKSPVSTKLYNKTKELREVHDKPYIRQAWFETGLVDNPQTMIKSKSDGTEYKPEIFRLEFSIKSPVKNWVTIEKDGNAKKYISIRNDLQAYDTDEKRLTMFASLVAHYFHFKYFEQNKSKYECRDKVLFKFTDNETFYHVEHPSSSSQQPTLDKRLERLLCQYREKKSDPALRQSIANILSAISEDDLRRLCENPVSTSQLLALQRAIALRLQRSASDASEDPARLITQLAQEILDFKPF